MIRLNNITKRYGKNIVLDNINVTIPENKIVFIMGKNGSGKTTLLKCILGLESFDGEIEYKNLPFKKVRHMIQAIFDDSPFYLNLSGYRNLQLLLNKKVTKEQIRQLALKFLSDELLKSKVKEYSYGQRKKLSLILTILDKPKYLLMDEVSNGLDFETMEKLKQLLLEWSNHMTIIVTGHQFEFYSSIIDELFILKNSKMILVDDFKNIEGGLSELYREYIQ